LFHNVGYIALQPEVENGFSDRTDGKAWLLFEAYSETQPFSFSHLQIK